MAFSNAERQKRWRDQRKTLVKQAANGIDPAEIERRLAPIIRSLHEETKKSAATISVVSIALDVARLRKLVRIWKGEQDPTRDAFLANLDREGTKLLHMNEIVA